MKERIMLTVLLLKLAIDTPKPRMLETLTLGTGLDPQANSVTTCFIAKRPNAAAARP